jgi:hypothetical protein
MTFTETKRSVFNRGIASDAFLEEMVNWARNAPDDIFEPNSLNDIFAKVRPELGPYTSLHHRKAVMLEVMRVLAGFESSWDWREGVDTSRLGDDTPENNEAGAWQVSYDARRLHPSLQHLLAERNITNGVKFQQAMKFDHPLAMEFVARLMRVNTRHNGPLYKGDERLIIRRSLRGPEHSIYPWLSREAVGEFEALLANPPEPCAPQS